MIFQKSIIRIQAKKSVRLNTLWADRPIRGYGSGHKYWY